MLAAATNEPGVDATKHFALNHLGTPQVTTNHAGGDPEIEHYWGFGGIAGNEEPSDEVQRFTGHERDFHLDDNQSDDLDYMHARYCSPHLRRFLSVDPARSAQPNVPQSWNRYAYALNNPVKFVDPDGEIAETAWDVGNVAVGVASFIRNVRDRNIGGAILDGVGVVVDTAATVTPFVPGGVGAALKVARGADKVADVGQAARKIDLATESARTTVKAANIKVLTSRRLKKLGVDAEAFKADVLNSSKKGSQFNIGIDAGGDLVLVPVKKGNGGIVETGVQLDLVLKE